MPSDPAASDTPQPASSFMQEFAAMLGVDPATVSSLPPRDPEAAAARAQRAIVEARRADRERKFLHDVGDTYQASDWAHPNLAPWSKQIERIRSWQVGPKGLLVAGETGRGKTRSVSDLYRRLAVEQEVDVEYWKAIDWFAKLQEQIRYGRDDALGWVLAHAKRPVYILDDFGQESVQDSRSDWSQAWFLRFLDRRRELGLPLIITTNLTGEDIAGTHDGKRNLRADPILRRLLDLCVPVNFETAEEQAARLARAAELSASRK